jgi:hypothetical protein
MLGSLGAAALAGLLPFKPKAQDIVIATSMPPLPEPVEATRAKTYPDAAALWPGGVLYDKDGREVAFVTAVTIDREAVDMGELDGWHRCTVGRIRGRLDAEIIFPVDIACGRRDLIRIKHDGAMSSVRFS